MIVFCAEYLFLLPPLLVLCVFWKKERDERRLLFYRGLLILGIGFLLAKAGGALYDEQRPFIIHHFHPLVPHVADNGFPSDHTLVSAGFGLLLLTIFPTAAFVALLAAVIVGASRVACGLHSPLDIIASFLFALAAASIAAALVRKPKHDSSGPIADDAARGA